MTTPHEKPQGFDTPVNLADEADFWLGSLNVQPSNCRVTWDNVVTSLQPKVMQVLVALAQADGRVVSREDLVRRCWNGMAVGDDSIQRCIARLRKLSGDAAEAFVVETQARVGYRLITEQGPNEAAASAIDETPRASSPHRLRPFFLIAAASGVALMLSFATFKMTHATRSPYLLAVRSFRVHNVDAALGESIANRIASAVAERQLPIVSPERSLKGDLDGARYILDGELEIQNGIAKAVVDLGDTGSGMTVWSTSSARPASEVDELQDQVAGKVADQIGLMQKWLGAEGAKAKPEAVAALIKATELMRRGPEAVLETRDSLRRFKELEPNLSRAHSAFAMATALSASTQPPEVAAQWRRQAADEAHQAIALDPHNGEPYMVLGVLTPWRRIADREKLYRRGLDADPNDPSLFDFLGELLLGVGRVNEAAQWIDRSVKADPFSSPKTQSLIASLAIDGQFDQAKPLFARAERLWPDDVNMHRTILFTRLVYDDPKAALAALDEFQLGDKSLEASRAAAWRDLENYRLSNKLPLPGRKLIDTTSASMKSDDLSASVVALSLIGDPTDAFKILKLADQKNLDFDIDVVFGPAAKLLRSDARLQRLWLQLEVANYWSATNTKPDFCAAQANISPCH